MEIYRAQYSEMVGLITFIILIISWVLLVISLTRLTSKTLYGGYKPINNGEYPDKPNIPPPKKP
jgi:hypothetical protein